MEGQKELRAPYARRMRGLLRDYARRMRAMLLPARAKLRAEPANFFNLPPKSESLAEVATRVIAERPKARAAAYLTRRLVPHN